jgi:PAS domain S-box-containing protein
MIGRIADEAVGRAFWDVFLSPEEVDMDRDLFARLVAGGAPPDATQWRIRKGHARQVAWSNATLVAPWGRVEYIIATGIDVSEQKDVEEALRPSKGPA